MASNAWTRSLVCVRMLLAIAVAAGSFAAPHLAAAQTARFVFVVAKGYEADVNALLESYSQDLGTTYDLMAAVYGLKPPLPIYIRIYASREELDQQNLLVPPVPPEATHTHLAAREIALIAPFAPGFLRSRAALDALRFELNGIFLSALSGNNLPGGLELGISQYVTLPAAEAERAAQRVMDAQSTGQLLSWRALFAGDAAYRDADVAFPQALTIAAFLVDRFGFPALAGLARALSAGQPLSAAMAEVYGVPFDRLEIEWQAYVPVYAESGWEHNALYNFDLGPYEAALAGGSYGQVARGLEALLPFLMLTGQMDAHARATALLAGANQGLAAGGLVMEARTALEYGNYQQTLTLVDQARGLYGALGANPRAAELDAYEARARQVLDLRALAAQAGALIDGGQVREGAAMLAALAPRLRSVGDANMAAAVELRLQQLGAWHDEISARQAALARYVIYLAVVMALLVTAHQLIRLLQRRPRDAAEAIL